MTQKKFQKKKKFQGTLQYDSYKLELRHFVQCVMKSVIFNALALKALDHLMERPSKNKFSLNFIFPRRQKWDNCLTMVPVG